MLKQRVLKSDAFTFVEAEFVYSLRNCLNGTIEIIVPLQSDVGSELHNRHDQDHKDV